MLDQAKELGCLHRVRDEGGFWEKRDLPALVQEIGSWNEMIAALRGKLKDLDVQSAISHYPNFEQLKAAGQAKLPPGYGKLAGLIRRIVRVPRESIPAPEASEGEAPAHDGNHDANQPTVGPSECL